MLSKGSDLRQPDAYDALHRVHKEDSLGSLYHITGSESRRFLMSEKETEQGDGSSRISRETLV